MLVSIVVYSIIFYFFNRYLRYYPRVVLESILSFFFKYVPGHISVPVTGRGLNGLSGHGALLHQIYRFNTLTAGAANLRVFMFY